MRLLFVIWLLIMSGSVMACPFCNSATAKAVRASLLGPDLAFNIVVTLLPFFICFGIAALIYHGGIPAKKPREHAG